MANLLELFAALDNWNPAAAPDGIVLDPDPVIAAARQALAGKGDVATALAMLEEQIVHVRPALRALRFGLIEISHPDQRGDPSRLAEMASELHQLAAQLLMRQQHWEQARDHLMRAISCTPTAPNPRFLAVELYVEIGVYQDAFDLLEQTFDSREDLEGASFQLYHLSRDVQARGAYDTARAFYERLIRRDGDDVFADLARLQIANIDGGLAAPAPQPAIDTLFGEALAKLRQNDLAGERALLFQILCWHPGHVGCWFAVGSAYRMQAEQHAATSDSASAPGTSVPDIIDDTQYQLLGKAVRALCTAVMFNPTLVEAQLELIRCLICLDLRDDALVAAEAAARAAPSEPAVLETLATVYLMSRDLSAAARTARQVLAVDPGNQLAAELLTLLKQPATPDSGTPR